MQYFAVPVFFALLALLLLALLAPLLLTRGWLLVWLRGTASLAGVLLALGLLLLANDLRSYPALPVDKPLLVLSFSQQGAQHYQVQLLEGGQERQLQLAGDLWQLDMRLLDWQGIGRLIGLQPGYRLEQLSGRYLSMEQQQRQSASEQALARLPLGLDLWPWLRQGFTLFEAQTLRLSYLPMADGAVFAVRLGAAGLVAEPLNPAARQALADWR